MKSHFLKLFNYDYWANQRMVAAMQQCTQPDERCVYLFSHILAAQEIWYGRITGNTSSLAPFPVREFDACIVVLHDSASAWRNFLEQADDAALNRMVLYKNTKGIAFSNTVTDILTHVINHSTYHRAQITSALKGKTEPLPVTDFIAFARE